MKAHFRPLTRTLAAAMLGAGLIAAAVPALSQTSSGPDRQASEQRRFDPEKMRERMRVRAERMAERLGIQPSQQDAWTTYLKARESLFARPGNRPGRDADAATLTRFRAEMAQERAQKLATLADATANLQNALSPDQRKILDEMARRGGRGKRGHGMHGHGMRG